MRSWIKRLHTSQTNQLILEGKRETKIHTHIDGPLMNTYFRSNSQLHCPYNAIIFISHFGFRSTSNTFSNIVHCTWSLKTCSQRKLKHLSNKITVTDSTATLNALSVCLGPSHRQDSSTHRENGSLPHLFTQRFGGLNGSMRFASFRGQFGRLAVRSVPRCVFARLVCSDNQAGSPSCLLQIGA